MFIKFFDRLLLLFIPAKHQPDYPYLKHISTKRIHLFTVIQFLSIGGLILVKSFKATAIMLPLFVSRLFKKILKILIKF